MSCESIARLQVYDHLPFFSSDTWVSLFTVHIALNSVSNMNVDLKNKLVLAVGAGAAILSAAAAYKFFSNESLPIEKKNSKQLVKEWKAVGSVTALHIFPIKSCQGIQVEEAQAGAMGLAVNEDLQDRFCHLTFTLVN